MTTLSLADLEKQHLKVNKHEKILKECLEMIRKQKNKIEIERLQLESMMDELKIEACKRSKPNPQFQPLPLGSTTEINDQELQLDVSDTLSNMLLGSYYENQVEEEEEEEDEEEEEEEEDDDVCVIEEVKKKKQTKEKDPHADIFDLIDF